MRRDPQMLLRGFGKLIAIVVVAGLAGAIIGIGLAELTGSDDASTPIAPVTSTASPAATQTVEPVTPTQTETQATTATETQPQTSTTIAPSRPVRGFKVPKVDVLSARIARLSADGGTRVTVRVRVTNRRGRALTPEDPVLLEGPDAIELDDDAKDAAGAVPKALEPGETASGTLRFTVPSEVAERIRAAGKAQLKIATRTINLRFEVA